MIANHTVTPGEFANASTDIVNGYGSAFGLGPTIGIVGVVVYGAIVFAAASFLTNNYRRYAALVKLVGFLSGTIEYFLKGIGALGVVAITFAPLYLLAQADGETQGWILGGLAVLVVGYFAIAGIGYVADRIYQRAREQHEMYQRIHGEESDDVVADGGSSNANKSSSGGDSG